MKKNIKRNWTVRPIQWLGGAWFPTTLLKHEKGYCNTLDIKQARSVADKMNEKKP